MYTLLITIIYLAFISLGLPDSLLGAGWACFAGTEYNEDYDIYKVIYEEVNVQDPSLAAEYLTSTYSNTHWHRNDK